MDDNLQLAFLLFYLASKKLQSLAFWTTFHSCAYWFIFMFVILDPMSIYWAGWRADFDKPRNCLAQQVHLEGSASHSGGLFLLVLRLSTDVRKV